MKKISAVAKVKNKKLNMENDAFYVLRDVFMILLIIAGLIALLAIVSFKNRTVITAKIISVERSDKEGTRRVGSGAYKKSVTHTITILKVKLVDNTGKVQNIQVNIDGENETFCSKFKVGNVIEYIKSSNDIYSQHSYFKIVN